MTMKKQLIFLVLFGITLIACEAVEKEAKKNIATDSFILSNENQTAQSPYLTKDNKGNPVVSWVEGKDENTFLYYRKWNDKKNKFGAPIKISVTKGLAAHHESMPKMA